MTFFSMLHTQHCSWRCQWIKVLLSALLVISPTSGLACTGHPQHYRSMSTKSIFLQVKKKINSLFKPPWTTRVMTEKYFIEDGCHFLFGKLIGTDVSQRQLTIRSFSSIFPGPSQRPEWPCRSTKWQVTKAQPFLYHSSFFYHSLPPPQKNLRRRHRLSFCNSLGMMWRDEGRCHQQ